MNKQVREVTLVSFLIKKSGVPHRGHFRCVATGELLVSSEILAIHPIVDEIETSSCTYKLVAKK